MSVKKFFKEFINGDQFVLVDFFVEWCGFCKVMVFIFQEVVVKIVDFVKIIKIDVDKNQVLVNQLGICGVFIFILFQNGEIKWC